MFFSKDSKFDSSESIDIIENIVYEYLKPFGFKKHGRTLHRFVDKDISQVVHFQNACPQKRVYGILWINLGIRVPECDEKSFIISQPQKKYYHEYDCNIRTRLGCYVDKKDTWYSLKDDPKKTGKDIIEKLEKYILPVFEVLSSREAIIRHRKDYASFDQFNNRLILLEESMIYGRKGNIEKASELFNKYYQEKLNEYLHDFEYGTQKYFNKGDRIEYLNTRTNQTETIVATKNGYVTLYNANNSHLKYLEELADKLNIQLIKEHI